MHGPINIRTCSLSAVLLATAFVCITASTHKHKWNSAYCTGLCLHSRLPNYAQQTLLALRRPSVSTNQQQHIDAYLLYECLKKMWPFSLVIFPNRRHKSASTTYCVYSHVWRWWLMEWFTLCLPKQPPYPGSVLCEVPALWQETAMFSVKCGLRMKKHLSIERADERHASVDARIKHRAMTEYVTKSANDSASHTTSTDVATLHIRLIPIRPSRCPQQRLGAFPCCRQAAISDHDTIVL